MARVGSAASSSPRRATAPLFTCLFLLLSLPRHLHGSLSDSERGEKVSCDLCGVVSRDLFKATIGIQGEGFGPQGFQFKQQFGAGELIDVVSSICHIEATPDWDEEKLGLPPVALSHGYVLWQNNSGALTARRKDDVDESLIGWAMVDAAMAKDVLFHACEHIRSIDVDVADQFAA